MNLRSVIVTRASRPRGELTGETPVPLWKETQAGSVKISSMTGEKLLVFVKAPRPGIVKTRLAKSIGAGPACAAYCQIVTTLLSQLKALGTVEICYTPEDALGEIQSWLQDGWVAAPQCDGDLGQRLHSAFERSFEAGASRIVAIGSDCPEVTARDVREAWNSLRVRDVVLGPATDGGYWLIGLRRIQPDLFRDIPWGGEDVFAETMNRIGQRGLSVQLLRPLADVDTESDWRGFLAARKGSEGER
jgi:uncharacterized protein